MSLLSNLFSKSPDACCYCDVKFAPGEMAFGPIGPNRKANWAHWDCWRRANPAPNLDDRSPDLEEQAETLEQAIARTMAECLDPSKDHDHSTPEAWKRLVREGYR